MVLASRVLAARALPSFARIVEVGPRDGLQNEVNVVPTETKVDLVNRLANAGLKSIEVTSFVSKKWVPQLGDAEEVIRGIEKFPEVTYSALVPNERGLSGALKSRISEIAIFTAASEGFCRKNINCSISESFDRFRPVIEQAQANNVAVRGYVSCVIGCPYDGPTEPAQVASVAKDLIDLGCYEVSLGDTIGVGTPGTFGPMLDAVVKLVPPSKLAIHCHDTYGQALANIYLALSQYQINVVDSSVAGLGGCPYAEGASGNVATEDVVYMLQGMGVHTGVDLAKVVSVGKWISTILKRKNGSRVGLALGGKL